MHISRLGEEERRRQRLKSQTKVLRDGRREGSASTSSMLSGVGIGPRSVLGLESAGSVGSFGVGAAGAGDGGFWAGQPGDGSVFGRGVVKSPEMGEKGDLRGKSPGPGQAQGVVSNQGIGRESPKPGGSSGNGHGPAVPAEARSSPGQRISSRGSPGPQAAGVARGGSPRGSPRPRNKDGPSPRPSPRPSAERGRDRVMEGQGLGIKLGVTSGV
jgi:hypothetical protein